MKSRKLLAMVIILMVPIFASAQYKFAIGIRSGGTSGLTVKYNPTARSAFEGIIGFWNDGLSLTGLWERHVQAFDVEGMHWYYGGGGHIAFYDADYRGERGPAWWDDDRDDWNDGDLGLGIDGIVGLEYKIPPIPFAISIDLKPFLEVNTDGGTFLSLDPGLGIKLAF